MIKALGKCSPLLVLLVSASCASDTAPTLLKAPDETPGKSPATFSRKLPILEGRGYTAFVNTLHSRGDETPELRQVRVELDGNVAAEAIATVNARLPEADYIKFSDPIEAVCISEIIGTSNIIPPFGTAEEHDQCDTGQLTGPCTYGCNEPDNEECEGLARVVPGYAAAAFRLNEILSQQQTDACGPELYWVQEMLLCIARHYLEFAEATSPYELVLSPLTLPASRLPSTDPGALTNCMASPAAISDCTAMGLSIIPDTRHDENKAALEQVAAALPATFPIDTTAVSEPLVVWPVQNTQDKATMALLSVNYYQVAALVGGGALGYCVEQEERPPGHYWADTYDRKAIPIGELLVTNLVDGTREMMEAANKAKDFIRAAADNRAEVAQDLRQHQLQWRGRTNSRLEALHAFQAVPDARFQAEDASLDEAARQATELFPVYETIDSTAEVDRAAALLLSLKIDANLTASSNRDDLIEALRMGMMAEAPRSASTMGATPSEFLELVGLSSDDVHRGAHALLDFSRTTGQVVTPMDGDHGVSRVAAIPDHSGVHMEPYDPNDAPDSDFFFAAYEPIDPQVRNAYLYALTVGDFSNASPLTSNPSSAMNHVLFAKWALENLEGRIDVWPYVAQYPLPAGTTPTIPADQAEFERQQIETVEAGATYLKSLAPVELWYGMHSGEGGVAVFSSKRENAPVDIWRGERGLYCALHGQLGGVPCDESSFRIETEDEDEDWYEVDTNPISDEYFTDLKSWGFAFELQLGEEGTEVGDRVYVTLGAPGHRKVLGGFTIRDTGNIYEADVAGDEALAQINELVTVSSSDPLQAETSCAEVPTNLRIPLEDSLQSTPPAAIESSFMHYLAIAREAATAADALGDEIYRQGLEMDLRAEVARDELESICGGIVNIDSLAPTSCTSADECCPGATPDCGAECNHGFCTGGSVEDKLRARERVGRCSTNDDCGSGERCIGATGSSDLTQCVRTCMPSVPTSCSSLGSTFQCVEDAPGLHHCEQQCSSSDECESNFDCVNGRCIPSAGDQLNGISECLGEAEGGTINVALGKKPLCAWRQGSLPLCACDPADLCPPEMVDSRGVVACPFVAEGEECSFDHLFDDEIPTALADFEDATDPVRIDATLNLDVSPATTGGGLSCRDLARFRERDGDPSAMFAILESLNRQAWFQQGPFQKLANSLGVETDSFGFVTLTLNGAPWLKTGSVAQGPNATEFPMAPIGTPGYAFCDHDQPFKQGGPSLACRGVASDTELLALAYTLQLFGGRTQVAQAQYFEIDMSYPRIEESGTEVLPSWLIDTPNLGQLADTRMQPLHWADGNPRLVFPDYHVGYYIENGSFFDPDNYICKNGYINNPFCITDLTEFEEGTPERAAMDQLLGIVRPRCQNEANVYRISCTSDMSDKWWDSYYMADSLFVDAGRSNNSLRRMLSLLDEGYLTGDDTAPILGNKGPCRQGGCTYGDAFGETGVREMTVSHAMDALELGCLAITNAVQPDCGRILSELPVVEGAKDFPALADRLVCAATFVESSIERLSLNDVPEPLVRALKQGEISNTSSLYHGLRGAKVQELQGALEELVTASNGIVATLRDFSGDVRILQAQLDRIDNQGEILDLRKLADAAAQASACMSSPMDGLSGGWIGAIVAGVVGCSQAAANLVIAFEISDLEEANLELDSQIALTQMSLGFSNRLDSIIQNRGALTQAYANISRILSELDVQQGQAQRAAAQALFLDEDATGRTYNVNTAMRRRMSTLRARYDVQLKAAKKAAYVARRAIEQRLGFDLATMREDMTLVDAPADWANQLCSMSGIDYERIRDSNSSPVENTLDDNFSAGYIGDYVDKLEAVVESYRIDHPFQDGHDTVVASLRDDLIKTQRDDCPIVGPNLLHRTANLDSLTEEEVSATEEEQPGWRDYSTGDAFTVPRGLGSSPKRGMVLNGTARVPGGQAVELSAVRHTCAADTDCSTGVCDCEAGDCEAGLGVCDGTAQLRWGQSLELATGSYILSWYERTQQPSGGSCDGTTPSAPVLDVVVQGTNEGAIEVNEPNLPWLDRDAATQDEPQDDLTDSCWARTGVLIEVAEAQRVGIYFALPSTTSTVAFAQPQLERGEARTGRSPNLAPIDFFPTTDVLTGPYGVCEDASGEQLRARFDSGATYCDEPCASGDASCGADLAERCYHEIKFSLPLSDIENGTYAMSAGFSAGNFNYRHDAVAVNLVGTDIHSCEGTQFPSECYASGNLDYSLLHDGQYEVRNFRNELYPAPLHPGRITHARALSAERYLTNPVASADDELLADYWRTELRGRPLQGEYTLRIYDTVARDGVSTLNFEALEDVQIVFRYNYWTHAR